MNSEWLCDLAFEDLPEQYTELAEVIGIDATIKLCETFGGMARYIPVTDALFTAARAKRIRREYNGNNSAKLARQYDLSLRAVQYIVHGQNPQVDGQISLDDILKEA